MFSKPPPIMFLKKYPKIPFIMNLMRNFAQFPPLLHYHANCKHKIYANINMKIPILVFFISNYIFKKGAVVAYLGKKLGRKLRKKFLIYFPKK